MGAFQYGMRQPGYYSRQRRTSTIGKTGFSDTMSYYTGVNQYYRGENLSVLRSLVSSLPKGTIQPNNYLKSWINKTAPCGVMRRGLARLLPVGWFGIRPELRPFGARRGCPVRKSRWTIAPRRRPGSRVARARKGPARLAAAGPCRGSGGGGRRRGTRRGVGARPGLPELRQRLALAPEDCATNGNQRRLRGRGSGLGIRAFPPRTCGRTRRESR